MKTIYMPTECYLRGYNVLLEADIAENFLPTAIEYFFHKSPLILLCYSEQMTLGIQWQIVNIYNHSQTCHEVLFRRFCLITFSAFVMYYLWWIFFFLIFLGSIVSACILILKPRLSIGTSCAFFECFFFFVFIYSSLSILSNQRIINNLLGWINMYNNIIIYGILFSNYIRNFKDIK